MSKVGMRDLKSEFKPQKFAGFSAEGSEKLCFAFLCEILCVLCGSKPLPSSSSAGFQWPPPLGFLYHPRNHTKRNEIDYTQSSAARALETAWFIPEVNMPFATNVICAVLSSALIVSNAAGVHSGPRPRWRAATEIELRKLIPARAPVIKENIETEFRTASGVTDGRGKFIAGVVLITAGYSAEGKYSHFFITQAALKIGTMLLQPGEYVFGYQRINNDSIRVSFYRASSGEAVGTVDAHVNRKGSMVRSLLISPPIDGRATIQVGRFLFEYKLSD